MGAVAAGFLFRAEGISYPTALLILGGMVTLASFFTLAVKFSPAEEETVAKECAVATAARRLEQADRKPIRDLIPGLRHVRPMDALRMYLGVALVIKGIYFITNMAEVESALSGPLPEWQTFVAWGVVFAHVIGGASLALGFITRVSAGINAIVALGAVGVHAFGTDVGGLFSTNADFQLAVMVFFTLVLITWRGAGPMSLDRLLGDDKRVHEEAIVAP
jgi:putative oxidoreductase